MQPITVSLSYPDGALVSMTGQGVIVYAVDAEERQMSAIGGEMSIGNLSQLMTELTEAFGAEDVVLALSLALVAQRLSEE